MSPTRLLFEGPDIHAVLAQVRGEYGTDVRIVAADKVRSGGIAGFFARERFEVAVEIDLNETAGVETAGEAESVAESVAELAAVEPMLVEGMTAESMPAERQPTRDLGTLIVSSPGHPPVIEDSPELPPSFLLGLIESVEATEQEQFTPSGSARRAAPAIKSKPAAPVRDGGFAAVLDGLRAEADELEQQTAQPEPMPHAAVKVVAGPATGSPESVPTAPASAATKSARASRSPRAPRPAKAAPAAVVDAPAPERRAAVLPSRGVFLGVGLPGELIPDRRQALPTYEALLVALEDAARPPQLPANAGEVIAVVGSGADVLAIAELVVAALGGDRAPIELVASRAAEHADGPLRMWGPGDARRRAARLARRDTPTVVAIDRAHDVDGAWTTEVLAALDVSAVCAVVDARTKPRDLEAYVRSLGRVEALAVDGCSRTVDPATVFSLGLPIIGVDGRASSPQVWAGLLAGLIDEASRA